MMRNLKIAAVCLLLLSVLAGCSPIFDEPLFDTGNKADLIEPTEIKCTVTKVDAIGSVSTDVNVGVGFVGGHAGAIVSDEKVPSVEYYVYLTDEDGRTIQFRTESDVYMAMKQMTGGSVTVEFRRETRKYYWNGKRLWDPIEVQIEQDDLQPEE